MVIKTLSIRILRKILTVLDPPEINLYNENIPQREGNKKLIVCVGVGRSGMLWFSEIFDAHDRVKGLPDPLPVYDAFFRYCIWNNLPIDHTGYFRTINSLLTTLWDNNDCIIIASPYIGIDIQSLENYLKPDAYIFSLRDPYKVINSLYCKGWYQKKTIKEDKNLASGIQPFYHLYQHHFSRITPTGHFFEEWNQLTITGKCAWYWNQINLRIYKSLSLIEENRKCIYKLEDIDQNYDYYKKLANNFSLTPRLSEKEFKGLKRKLKNVGKKKRDTSDWTGQEKEEVKQFISPFYKIYKGLKTTLC